MYQPPTDAYSTEIVDRCAPRWAWEVIDETLRMDSQAANFVPALRDQILAAQQAIIDACEDGR